jgi:NADH-ubiquinone oxidoreductase chain 6
LTNLYIYLETLSNFRIEILNIVAIFSILCGIFVIISKNPIISILFLIGLFGGISSYLIFIGLSFIALSYLIIYIGAISILFLFIIMLINIRTSELQNNNKNSLFLGIMITIILSYFIFQVLPFSIGISNNDLFYLSQIFLYLFPYILGFFYLNIDNEIYIASAND